MDTPPRHLLMVRLFRGDFGDNIYTNAVLVGRGGGKTVLLSYLALFADDSLDYARVTTDSITEAAALSQVQSLLYPRDLARSESRNAQSIVFGSSEEELDALVWRLGVEQTAKFGLPVIFLTWMRKLADSQPQVVLWYPLATQGQWALETLKRRARR